jgi:hypothetical protein
MRTEEDNARFRQKREPQDGEAIKEPRVKRVKEPKEPKEPKDAPVRKPKPEPGSENQGTLF